MKLFLRVCSILILIVSYPSLSEGQNAKTPWSLQQCIDYALKNNLQIRQAELSKESNVITLTQYKANLLPTLNGSAYHNYSFGRTIDPYTNTPAETSVLSENFSLNAGLTLFNGLQKWNTIKQGQFDLLASKEDEDKMKNDVSLNIAGAYLQILFNDELRNVAHNQVGISQIQVERTKKLVDAGALARGNLLQLQAQLAVDELSEANAQNQVDLSYLNLVQLLDMDSAGSFSIVKPALTLPSESILTMNASQIYSIAVTGQPMVKSAQYKLKSYNMQLKIAKGGAYPRLMLLGSYGTVYSGQDQKVLGITPTGDHTWNGDYTATGVPVYQPSYTLQTQVTPYFDQISNNVNKSIGLNLTVPIFNGLQTHATVERAKVQLKNADLNLQIQELQLRKTIQQAYADANAALIKFHATTKTVEATAEAFKYTEQKFNVGMLNSLDYNDAKNKLIKAESDLLQAKYDFIFKAKVLDFYQGKPLTL
jgi:outer membrane protein